VLDQRVLADAQVLSDGGKTEVRVQDALSGGCLNALRAAAQQGAAILPVLLVGLDPLRRHIEMLVKQQFPQSILLSMLRESRRSILCGDSVATVRSAMVCQRLPESAQRRLSAADLVIVAPMTEQDTQFVAAVLSLARQSVLLLSNRQLADAEAAVSLSHMATWTGVNRRELVAWKGCQSLDAGLLILRGLGVERLLVTQSEGVVIEERGDSRFQPSLQIELPTSTVGAGDVFAGIFAACLATGCRVHDAVRNAQLAAAEFLQQPTETVQTGSDRATVCTHPNGRLSLPPLPLRSRNSHGIICPIVPAVTAASAPLAAPVATFGG
jgi:sugar/nucleoside kinase (ribokinase family)